MTKSAAVAVARTGTADVDPAVTRFLDGAVDGTRPVRQHAGRLPGRPDGAVALAGDAERIDHQGHARRRAGLHRLPRGDGRATALHCPAAVISFRRFYRHLLREGSLRDDPTAQIAMPKIGRSLPKSLSEEEVESLAQRAGCIGSAGQP